ncbi:cupin domain-containing protein [Flavobacterium silvaticum]|uniref:Cupin domain-containing protein n=1 Tax=Flavobacterium silvaticum TaxID=1852020 RepID=A0A972JI61_9FLAO|nr:cupin domain-containing protein [Flavobacterium silvaticum]NMH26982.1 cupin domain-containing protein [Flavobacterium silvaticum]
MKRVSITDNDSARVLQIAGGSYRVLLSGDETNGRLASIEMRVPVGKGPIPHEHPGFAESFYVASGEVSFETAAGKKIVSAGGFVQIPLDGEPHRFINTGNEEAVLLCTVQPAGLDAFFTEVDDLLHGNPPDETQKQQLAQLSVKYGQTVYPPDYFDNH